MRVRGLSQGLVATAVTVALVGTLNSSVAQAGATPRCFGEPATIVGGPGALRVEGTAGRDVIFSRWEGTVLYGRGGNDLLCGGSDIHGGEGNDRMTIHSAGPTLIQSALFGGPGNDEIHRQEVVTDDPHFWLPTSGGEGDDRLFGGLNLDHLRGGPGRDRVFGSDMQDRLLGGPGNDFMVGGWARDRLKGGPGDDRLLGKRSKDRLRGGLGDDVARGGPGDDRIRGLDGEDVAHGGTGFDWCDAEREWRCEAR